MNLDSQANTHGKKQEPAEKKKLTRKEKKALKQVQADAPVPEAPPAKPSPAPQAKKEEIKSEEVEAKLDLSPVNEIPPPHYTTWEKISPPARRRKQISNMESGFREVLGLVHSMRHNQEVLLDAFKKLPEAVESVKKLADHSAQQSDLLKAMNEQMGTGSAGEFNKTLSSMDQTTQMLLERAQRSEEKLYSMLRRAQRRIAFMTLMVLMLFIGAVAAVVYVAFPETAQPILDKLGMGHQPEMEKVDPIPAPSIKSIPTLSPTLEPLMPEEALPVTNQTAPMTDQVEDAPDVLDEADVLIEPAPAPVTFQENKEVTEATAPESETLPSQPAEETDAPIEIAE